MIGQDAVVTAQAFQEGVGFTGVVLTKLDGDARGGAALSVAHLTQRPIFFASTGEKLEDFDVFHPERMASRILGMGDVLTLIEQAEKAFDADQAQQMATKLAGDGFSLEDFLEQLLMVRKMGPIGNLLGMLPGMGQMKDAISQVDDRDLDRIMAIIRSMTPAERTEPKILNASRKARVAKGSGVTVQAVNQLLDRFEEARKMIKSIPGMPGMGGGGARAARRAQKKGKQGKGASRKGNPAARAAAAKASPNAGERGVSADNPFGLPAGADGMPDLSQLQLPPGGLGGLGGMPGAPKGPAPRGRQR
jgi:signal recognition particle subunit SRP54